MIEFYILGAYAIWMTINNLDRMYVIRKLNAKIQELERRT